MKMHSPRRIAQAAIGSLIAALGGSAAYAQQDFPGVKRAKVSVSS